MAAAAQPPPPPLDILVRSPEGFSLWSGPPFTNGQPGIKLDQKISCSTTKFSDDGSRLMVLNPDGVITIYDCRSYTEIRSFQVPNLTAAALSPRGRFVQTFQKSSTPQNKNVTLWNVDTGEAEYDQFQKSITRTNWPSIRFSADEAVACKLATNEIQFFDAVDFSKGVTNRLRVAGVAAIHLSTAPGSHVAAFVPEAKGIPASVQIFATRKDLQRQPVARKSFFRCSSVQLKWNNGSTGLLVVAQSDVDKTNQSYYRESKLYYLTTDGTHEGLVPLRKEGPVHDVQWTYSGSEFAVVYGFMPSKTTNPKGKFLCVAGFGNLPGDMAFWDYMEKKHLGTTQAELSVTSEWIKIFHHNGSLFFKKMFDKLFQADWKPESPDRFSDISELVKSFESIKVDNAKPQGERSKSSQTSAKAIPNNPPAQKPTAYRPPNAKQAAIVQAELFGGTSSETMSKNALRNKKKREKQKEKKATEGANDS
ncbi:hypothetical protein ACLB2K_007494 [Fragaria x ananassa]